LDDKIASCKVKLLVIW